MGKGFKILLVVFILYFMVNAANILVWNFNPSNYDTITDPEVGQKVNAGYWLKTTLTNNSYTFTYHDNVKLPTDISSYDVIVGTLGFFVCWSDNSAIDPADQTKLINHLNAGKGLYIEGVDLGYANSTTNFFKMLGANYLADGDKLTSLSGESGSLAAGKSYTYFSSTHPINGYIDEISANQGTLIFKCNGSKGRTVAYEEPTKKYKVIYSSFVFGGIRGIPEKNALMKIYMDWFIGGTAINPEQLTLIGNRVFLTNACGENKIHFTLSRPAKININLYTVTGKLVSQMADNLLSEGSHQLSLDNDMMSSGNYILRVKADEKAVNQLIFITK